MLASGMLWLVIPAVMLANADLSSICTEKHRAILHLLRNKLREVSSVLAGDGPEERRCAEARGWPFVQVALSAGQQTTVKGMRLTSIMAKDVLKAAHQ